MATWHSPPLGLDSNALLDRPSRCIKRSAILLAGMAACTADGPSGPAPPTPPPPPASLAPAPPARNPGREVVQIAIGEYHGCARMRDGTAWCWGLNERGQLGDGTLVNGLRPVQVRGLRGAVELSAGFQHTCARIDDGTVRCWGSNHDGQCGVADQQGSVPEPTRVDGLTEVAGIAVDTVSCARGRDGTVQCWGSIHGFPAAPVPGLLGVTQVVTRGSQICAVSSDRTVRCWGGWPLHPDLPTPVPSATGTVELALGIGHTYALFADGSVHEWESNEFGTRGDGAYASWVAEGLAQHPDALRTAVLGNDACALLKNGDLACWRDPAAPPPESRFVAVDHGHGTRPPRFEPVRNVPGAKLGDALRAGTAPLLVCSDPIPSGLRCWPATEGDRRTFGIIAVPGDHTTTMTLPTPAQGVASGSLAACARLADGTVWCWGSNVGGRLALTSPCTLGTERRPWQLDEAFHGPVTRAGICPAPVQVPGLAGVIDVQMGSGHACALIRGGNVVCWGDNEHGQVGDGTGVARATPTAVALGP